MRIANHPSWCVLVFLCCFAIGVEAQQRPTQLPSGYPAKPVRIMVGQPPGGTSDILARTLAQKFTERWGSQFIVDNKGGANGLISLQLLAQAEPDGHTILISGSTVILAAAMQLIKFDALKAFIPIVQLTTQPYLLVAATSVPAGSLKELIALAKSNPGLLNYASQGAGSISHLGMELLMSRAGVNIVHVPYKGTGTALVDLRGGQIQIMFAGVTSGGPHVKAGALKGLAVTSLARLVAMPDMPTVAESGFPEFELNNGFGFYTIAQTLPSIVDALNREGAQIISAPEFKAQLTADGAEPAAVNTPAQFKAMVEKGIAHWTAFIRSSGIKPES